MIRPDEPRPSRRRALRLAAGALLAAALPRSRAQQAVELRIGLTPVFLDDQVAFLNEWREYLATRLGRPVAFVQRGSYREVVTCCAGAIWNSPGSAAIPSCATGAR